MHPLDPVKAYAAASQEANQVAESFIRVLILPCTSRAYRAPIITLQGEQANIYYAIEKHLLPNVLVGVERFWKLVRASQYPKMVTWRPRVNGAQLKALEAARLPETEQEWQCVRLLLNTMSQCIRQDSSPEAFLQELKDTVVYCKAWWENRTKRDGT